MSAKVIWEWHAEPPRRAEPVTDRDDSSDHYRRRDPLELELDPPDWRVDPEIAPGGVVRDPDALGAPE